MAAGEQTVLILGAGINGCALARELALNGVSVWIVDTEDVSSGATSGSSRLIHGGLRYLEYGDFELVQESLHERTRLLKLAPQFVRPLELWVPVESRFGGALAAVGRFFDWRHWPAPKRPRGLWLVRAGLTLYDKYAHDPSLPRHHTVSSSDPSAPPVDCAKYRWLCAYYDAQVLYPERLCVAMLADAAALAQQQGVDFRVFTYHEARREGNEVTIVRHGPSRGRGGGHALRPGVVVNATGAWVDEALARLDLTTAQMMGGTKGSHILTSQPALRAALGNRGIYAEASDGRPVFILPLGDTVLIGTTDLPFHHSPGEAIASGAEIEYLIAAVNSVLKGVDLKRVDVDCYYSAVRPLPKANAATPGAITRRHALAWNQAGQLPILSLVGGKLTTMRSLAESAAAAVLDKLDRPVIANSRERPFPGAENYPTDATAKADAWREIAARTGHPVTSVASAWLLLGSRAAEVLALDRQHDQLPDTELPLALARWSIAHEWATTLDDLVERRLMLLYHQRLSRACLARLADLLIAAGHLSAEEALPAIEAHLHRLKTRYGKHVE